MIFQCKCCGGSLRVEENASTGVCEYCGNTMTIPNVDDEKVMNLFNRANHLRMKSEFDNAMIVYENIVAEDKKNAEAYWGICLCKYGIEYVTDPKTEKMIPTCHRSSFTSILQDEDYVNALKYADSIAQSMYRAEASQIAAIQERLLQISGKEEPYDIFICYKESDEDGKRTKDSVRAQDIYYELTKKKYRVFFSRISLAGKLGEEYEPYIFSALNSAKIMIVVGTSEKNMKAPWVKNEWSRFLALMNESKEKVLIPVYQDMDPYDMPEEFVHLQALDMSRLGFVQDLLLGIVKMLPRAEDKAVEESTEAKSNVSPLIQRAYIFLADEEWKKANDYAERVLDQEPFCGEAYLIKLLAVLQLTDVQALMDCKKSFDTLDEYKKVLQYADEEIIEEVKCGPVYRKASVLLAIAISIPEVERAQQLFKSISGYKDVPEKLERCRKKISDIQKEKRKKQFQSTYDEAVVLLDCAITIPEVERAQELFQSISDYKDVPKKLEQCREKIDERRKRQRQSTYDRAVLRLDCARTVLEVEKVQNLFQTISGYKDVPDKIELCKKKIETIMEDQYQSAIQRLENARTEKECYAAGLALKELADYKDCSAYCQKCAKKAEEYRQIKKKRKKLFAAILIGIIIVAGIFTRRRILYMNSKEYLVSKAQEYILEEGGYAAAFSACRQIENTNLRQEVYIQVAKEAMSGKNYDVAMDACKKITNISTKRKLLTQLAKTGDSLYIKYGAVDLLYKTEMGIAEISRQTGIKHGVIELAIKN